MPLTLRQKQIADIVEVAGPITGDQIARRLQVTRAALRSDLAILVNSGILAARTNVGYFYQGKNPLGLLAEELKSILVRDVQALPVAVHEAANAHDAMVAMFTEDVGSVFVVAQGSILAGILSRKDLLKASQASNGQLGKVPVQMVMTPLSKLVVAHSDETVVAAARKIIENEVDCLPVVQEIEADKKKYKLTGRLTKTTITRLFLELAQGKEVASHG